MGIDELVRRAREALEGQIPLRLAILFGSAARGELRPDSDVDLAILPEETDLRLMDELKLQAGLERALGRTVDLVRLDRANTLVRWEVARHGVELLSQPPTAFARFRAEAAIEHADMAPNLQDAAVRLTARLLSEESAS